MQTLLEEYTRLIDSKKLTPDPAQKALILQLQQFLDGLIASQALAESRSLRPLHLLKKISVFPSTAAHTPLRSLYIHGNVGQGKSMFMRMLFDHIPSKRKRILHFHAFMEQIHVALHQWQTLHAAASPHADGMEWVARQFSQHTRIICLDELYITEIGDAMLVARILSLLLAQGVLFVITSNRTPDQLYLDGVSKQHFKAFLSLLAAHTTVLSLAAERDYRIGQTADVLSHYHYPLGSSADIFLADWRTELLGDHTPEARTLFLHGRALHFSETYQGILFTDFNALCNQPLGPADYLCISHAFHTVILANIPALSLAQRNEAKRLVMLIDQLYQEHVCLICTAAVAPEALYRTGDGSFEFARTVSRLAEMQSAAYLAIPHRGPEVA